MSKMYFDRSGRFAAQWKREQQAGMILDVDINGEDLEDAVRKWMASNEDVWRAWIPNRGLRCSVPFRVDRSARNAVFLTLPELGTGGKRVSPAVSWTLPRGAESGAGRAYRPGEGCETGCRVGTRFFPPMTITGEAIVRALSMTKARYH